MSTSRLCFLPAGLPLGCASAGLFPCFSADGLSGEAGVKKIKFVNDDNTITLPEVCGEKIQRKCQEMRVIFTLGTSQPQRVYSRNFFLSIARVHRIVLLKTIKLWVAFLRTT